jgi:hypothetical protein
MRLKNVLCKEIVVVKSIDVKAGCKLPETAKEGYDCFASDEVVDP